MTMKKLLYIVTLAALVSCGKSGEHQHDASTETAQSDNPNKVLLDQIMDIHDEVMPKMQDLYTLKQSLQEKAGVAGISAEEKKSLEDMMATLDSANTAMMDWMHKFQPLPDSADQEKAREYLESEMERVMKVRELTNETIEKAKSITAKK
jgi:hypothetical protein